MKKIYKETLAVIDNQNVSLPIGAKILTVQVQNNVPCIWYLFDASAEKETEIRHLEIFGTGNPIYEDMGVSRQYIGTFQLPPFVWHLFEYTGI